MRIYVSSTTEDLREFRAEVAEMLRGLGHEPVFMDEQSASTLGAVQRSLQDVAGCDLYIGLFAFRYGYVAPGYGKSVTELEYRKARECGKRVLIFLADDRADWPARWFDLQQGARIAELRNELLNQEGHTACLFASLKDLLKKVAQAVHDLRGGHGGDGGDSDGGGGERRPVVVGHPFLAAARFQDRSKEIRSLQELLSGRQARLILVLGPNGTGKTALVSEVCLGVRSGGFPLGGIAGPGKADGLVYFDCHGADARSGERLFHQLAGLLGGREREEVVKAWSDTSRSYGERFRILLSRLERGHYLLALDNLEEMLGPDQTVSDECVREFFEGCLSAEPGLQILAASAEAILLGAGSMPYVDELRLDTGLPVAEGVVLLRELDTRGHLGLRDAPESLLRKAVERCCGLPQALIGVAAILWAAPALSLQELLEDSTLFDAKVLDNLAAEKYRRQGEDYRRVLEALAVYDKPVRAEAVRHLLGRFFPRINVVDALTHLAYSYAVVASRSTGTFEIQDKVLKQYAYRKIPEEGSDYHLAACHRAAADYFAEVRKKFGHVRTPEDLKPQLEEFDHRVKAAQYDEAASVLESIDQDYLQPWGLFRTVINMRQRLAEEQRLVAPRLVHSNLGNLALMYRRIGRLDEAIEHFKETIRQIRQTIRRIRSSGQAGCGEGEASTRTEIAELRRAEVAWLCELANTLADRVEMEDAMVCYQRGLRIAEKNADLPNQARLLGNLAIAHRQLGDMDQARACYDRALRIDREMLRQASDSESRRAAEKWLCLHHGNSSKPLVALGMLAEAFDISQEAIRMASENGFTFWQASFHERCGEVEVLRTNFPAAIEHFRQSIALLESMEEHRSTSYALEGLGGAYHHQGDLSNARAFYEQCRALDMPETRFRCEVMLGILDLEENQQESAAQCLRQGIVRCQELLRKAPRFYEAAYRGALALLANGEREAALAMYEAARAMCKSPGVRGNALLDLSLLRRAAPGTPGLDEAERLLNEP